jgi:hypothetical protein
MILLVFGGATASVFLVVEKVENLRLIDADPPCFSVGRRFRRRELAPPTVPSLVLVQRSRLITSLLPLTHAHDDPIRSPSLGLR